MNTMAEEEVQAIEALLYINKIADVEIPTDELLAGWRLLSERRKKLVLMTVQVVKVLFSDKIPEEVRQRVQLHIDEFPRLKIHSEPPTLS